MKYHIQRLTIAALSFFALLLLLYFSNQGERQEQGTHLSFQLQEQTIHAWKQAETYYVFLPSCGTPAQVQLDEDSFSFLVMDSQRVIHRGDTLADIVPGEMVQCENLDTGEQFFLCMMQSKNLPALFLSTQSGTMADILADEEYAEKGSLLIFMPDGSIENQLSLKGIHGRGNYAWENYDKKPFTLELKEPASILGLSAGEKYVLISNAADPTLIRNELVREMEKALEVTASTSGEFIDLYINGEYYGNYYLCEKIEIGETRLHITDLEAQIDTIFQKQKLSAYEDYISETLKGKQLGHNPLDITGGYLLEREFEDRYKVEYEQNPSSFITAAKEHFIVKSPRYCSAEQITYISTFVQEAEDAILSKDGKHPDTGMDYTEYVDLDSFVKKYLTEEVSKNYDGGISSAFFYKDGNNNSTTLHGGPGWDYDMTFGNYLDWMEYFSKDPRGISRLTLHDHASPWYDALLEKRDFQKLAADYYKQLVSPFLQKLADYGIDQWEIYLEASSAMDYIRWQSEYGKHATYVNREISFRELKDFISARKAFLDAVWIAGEQYHIVRLYAEGSIYEIRYIKDGEELGSLPDISVGGRRCLGWRRENEAWLLKGPCQIMEDTTLIGVFEPQTKVDTE